MKMMLRIVMVGTLILANANSYGMDRLKFEIGGIVVAGLAYWLGQELFVSADTSDAVPAHNIQGPAVVSKTTTFDGTSVLFTGPGIITVEDLVLLRNRGIKELVLLRCRLKGGVPLIDGLEKLVFRSVHFDDVDAEITALEVLPKDLKKLAIIQCGVVVVPDEIASMEGLNELDLSKNRGLQIKDDSFPACLDCLILDGCDLTRVPKAVSGLVCLKRLSLRDNAYRDNAYDLVINAADLPAPLEILRVDSLRQCGKDIILSLVRQQDKDGFFYAALDGRIKIYVTEKNFIPNDEE